MIAKSLDFANTMEPEAPQKSFGLENSSPINKNESGNSENNSVMSSMIRKEANDVLNLKS